MPNWYVYIAECSDGSLYTGITTNVTQRFQRHNAGRGSAYVRSKGTAEPIYSERVTSRSEALRREAEIKSWRREKKLEFIQIDKE